MNYNQIIPIKSNIYLSNKKHCAHDFSEGNLELEELLLSLWELGVKTKACCKGHELTRPYILLSYNQKQKEIFKTLLPNIINENLCVYFIKRKNIAEIDIYISSTAKNIRGYDGNALFTDLNNNIKNGNLSTIWDMYFNIIEKYSNCKTELEIEIENNNCFIFTNRNYTTSFGFDQTLSRFLRNNCIDCFQLENTKK